MRGNFKDLNYFMFFLGHGKSGHTLVRSVLDAHPNIILSNDYNIFKQLDENKINSKHQLFKDLLTRSTSFTESGCRATGYSYRIPSSYQGKFETIKVIGDKRGRSSASKISSNPQLILDLQNTVNIPVKVLHIIRNPFDVVASYFKRKDALVKYSRKHIAEIRDLTKSIKLLEERYIPVLNITHEEFVLDFDTTVLKILTFLDLEGSLDYIKQCKSIINKKPVKHRLDIKWPKDIVRTWNILIKKTDFLNGYTLT